MRSLARAVAVIFILCTFLVSCVRAPVGVSGPEDGALTAAENLSLAVIYESKGEIDLALTHFGLAIELDKRDPEAYFALANLNLKIRRYGAAESAYKRAIRLSPSSGPFYNNLGWLYMETGRLDKAAATVGEAIKRSRAGRHVYLDTLGVIEMKRARPAQAEKSFMSAIELTPPDDTKSLSIIYGHMLDLYEGSGRGGEAALVRERIKKIRP
jgi:Tfp pilus assembly protein PilF